MLILRQARVTGTPLARASSAAARSLGAARLILGLVALGATISMESATSTKLLAVAVV
jgi:hypothetical protein